jgi:inosine-uridine nucleoside N-ribohydrolase
MNDPIFIDTDNAMGSAYGDVDDAYAVAALLRSGLPIAGIGAVHGNTSERRAFDNNRRLADLLGYPGPVLRATETADFLRTFRGRVMALGPLTNIAAAQSGALSEVVIVGGNSNTRGRWPPVWPHEFNLVIDKRATRAVFASGVPLTIFPLNVARELYVHRGDLDAIGGKLGEAFRRQTGRWLRYLRFVRMTSRFAIYDLAAAMYAIDPAAFSMERTTAAMRKNTFMEFGRGEREVTICRALDRERLWRRFLEVTG